MKPIMKPIVKSRSAREGQYCGQWKGEFIFVKGELVMSGPRRHQRSHHRVKASFKSVGTKFLLEIF